MADPCPSSSPMCPSTHPSIATEPSTHPAGRILFPLGLGTALSLMGDATLYTVLPTHTVEAGVVLSQVGIILSVNRAIRVFLNGPAGIVYDKSPRRRLFVSALFVGALSTAVYAATKGFWPLLVGRLLWGLAWSGIWVGGATVIMDVTTLSDRGRWSGLYQTWFFLGAALGAFAGGLLTDKVGYTTTMWIGATLTALGGLVAAALLPETRPDLSAGPIRTLSPSTRSTEWTESRTRTSAPRARLPILDSKSVTSTRSRYSRRRERRPVRPTSSRSPDSTPERVIASPTAAMVRSGPAKSATTA